MRLRSRTRGLRLDGAPAPCPSLTPSVSLSVRASVHPRRVPAICYPATPVLQPRREKLGKRASFPFAAAASAASAAFAGGGETLPSGTANPVMYDRPTAVVARDLEAGRP